MTREDLIRDVVLGEICDDYENVDQIIFPHVRRDLAAAGVHVERDDVVRALKSLVTNGLATAHRLSEGPTPLPEVPMLDRIEDDETGYEIYLGHGSRPEVSRSFGDSQCALR